jgi:hypothetical protein
MSDETLDDLVNEFGVEILSSSHPHEGLTLRQCQRLLNTYGFETGILIIERWKKLKTSSNLK